MHRLIMPQCKPYAVERVGEGSRVGAARLLLGVLLGVVVVLTVVCGQVKGTVPKVPAGAETKNPQGYFCFRPRFFSFVFHLSSDCRWFGKQLKRVFD